jgi:L-lactate dehydrogenase
LSSARIAGTPLQEFCREQRLSSDDTALRTIADEARSGGQQIVLSKGSTQYGISAALTRIVGAILRDEHAVLTVSNLAPEQMNVGREGVLVAACDHHSQRHRSCGARSVGRRR